MIEIYFTQCDTKFQLGCYMKELALMPILPRLERYEEMLREIGDDMTYYTMDEHFLLVAQWLRRTGVIKHLEFVSVCACYGPRKEKRIVIDDEGDFTDDCHHGFFPQRLKYLR